MGKGGLINYEWIAWAADGHCYLLVLLSYVKSHTDLAMSILYLVHQSFLICQKALHSSHLLPLLLPLNSSHFLDFKYPAPFWWQGLCMCHPQPRVSPPPKGQTAALLSLLLKTVSSFFFPLLHLLLLLFRNYISDTACIRRYACVMYALVGVPAQRGQKRTFLVLCHYLIPLRLRVWFEPECQPSSYLCPYSPGLTDPCKTTPGLLCRC